MTFAFDFISSFFFVFIFIRQASFAQRRLRFYDCSLIIFKTEKCTKIFIGFSSYRENLERVIYFLLMDRKNKISYQEDDIPPYQLPRLEGKRARLRNFRKFNVFDKKMVYFFVRCVLLYASYKFFVYALSKVMKTVNDLKDIAEK